MMIHVIIKKKLENYVNYIIEKLTCEVNKKLTMGVYYYIMDLEFKTKKLKKQCEDPRIAQKEFGSSIGNKLTLRINEFRAACSLEDIVKNKIANGFHSLDGDRKKEFAVTLKHPHRLIFTINSEKSNDEDMSYNDIEFVRIEEVIDYHGKNKAK